MKVTNIIIDFQSDWIKYLVNELNSFGLSLNPNEEMNDILIKYFNLLRRLISSILRTVLKSREFTCPPELERGLQILEEKNNVDRG